MQKSVKDCIFCKIVKGEKSGEKILYDDGSIVVFADYQPRTSTHFLITPKKHYSDFSEMMRKEPQMLKKIGEVVEAMITKYNLKGKPYTWGFHAGGKQSVDHIHAQFLAGMKKDELVL